jgi:hypothetical protein
MGVRDETLALLQEGFDPIVIASKRGVSLNTTLAYLDQMVGEGRLRRSDILLSLPVERRLDPHGADIFLVGRYGDDESLLGDLYLDLRYIEVTLHQLIQEALMRDFGFDEGGWWRKGIPESIRKSCQVRREEDPEPVEAYCYTDLLDLWEIIEKKWTCCADCIPSEWRDKPELKRELVRLNHLRRMVMHPVRGLVPKDDDFDFVRRLRRQLEAME